MRPLAPPAALTLTLGLALPAAAQEAMDHAAVGEATAGYMAAMDTMMQAVDHMELTGDPDADFLLMMMSHHESAIAMAELELEHGEIGPVRELAQRIIDAQVAEIEEMRATLVEMNHANP